MEITFYFGILLITFLISTAFSTAGVGAANTLIPIYYSLGIPFSLAAATGLLLNVFSLSTATVNHSRNRHINWKLGITLLVPAVILAPVGALIGVHTPKDILLAIFLAFLLYSIYSLLRAGKRKTYLNLSRGTGLIVSVSIGCFAGFLGGLLGVGGGIVILPVLTFIEPDFKKVAGTSGFAALFISISGFLSYLEILKSVSYLLWIFVIAGGIAGGFLGSSLVDRFKSQSIRYLIVLIIGAVAIKLAYTILGPLFT